MTFRQKLWIGVGATLVAFALGAVLTGCGASKPPTLPTALAVADSDVIAIKGKALTFLEDLQAATIDARQVTDALYAAGNQSAANVEIMHGWFREANLKLLDAARKARTLADPTWAKLKALLDPVFTAIQPIYAYAVDSIDHKRSFRDWLSIIGGAFFTLVQIYGTAGGH